MKRVLMVVPPNVPMRDLASAGNYQTVHLASVPMGVLSIAAYCRAHVESEWAILDLNLYLQKPAEMDPSAQADLAALLAHTMAGKAPDVVGISCIFNAQAGYLGPIAAAARALWPETVIVTGGGFPTNMPIDTARLAPDIDAIMAGEAEKAFLRMLSADDMQHYVRKDIAAASGWPMLIYDVAITNLDDIPPLAYDLLDMDRYQGITRYHGGSGKAASVTTTRGCPHHCGFCASGTVHGQGIRLMSPERVLSDVRELVERYGIDTLLIEDDHFLGNRRHALAVLRVLAPLGLNIEFPNGLAVHRITPAVVEAMTAAGVRTATLAVESGCKRVLKEIIHKPWTDLGRVRRAVDLLRTADMYVRAFFVIGNPGETLAEMEETGRFMREMGANWCAIMIATPIAGSEYYRICRERGWLATEDVAEYHYGHGTIRTPDFEPKQVETMRYRLNLDVNFVHNYDLAHGRPDLALRGFRDVLVRVPDHAFACWYAGLSLGLMGRESGMVAMHGAYYRSLQSSEMWRGWAREFGLPLAEVPCKPTS